MPDRTYKPAGIFLLLLSALLASTGARRARAQQNPPAGSNIPLVYRVANTAAKDPPPAFPPFAQLPIIRPLPDAFAWMPGSKNGSGRDTSFASWERHRAEIMAAIEKYEIGPVPDCHDCTITANYDPPAKGSTTGTLTVHVTRNGRSLTLTSGVYIPQGMGKGPFPALIAMTFGTGTFRGKTFHITPKSPNYGSLPPAVFKSLPIATVNFVSTQVAGLTFGVMSHKADPFYQLYPELCAGQCPGTSNSGTYAAWTWGISRLIDGLEIATRQRANPLPIDINHLAVTGCSFAGKMALFAGAFDERIALTISQENGGGGAASWRVSHEIEADGSVEDIHDTSYDWFAGQMRQFAEDASYKLPEDHDQLMAMVAPRALLETGNADFYWLANRSNYISARATQKIYNTFGIGDRFGFYIDGGHAHCATLPAEAPAITAFVKKFLLGDQSVDSDIHVDPYPDLDYSRWTAWWGTDDPKFPNNWNPGDGSVVLSMSDSQKITPGSTVQGGYDLSMPGRHPAATVSLSGANVQTDVACADGTSYTLTVPLPDHTYSIPPNNRSWLPSGKQKSALVYQGSVKADAACSDGVTDNTYFSVLGKSAGVGKPPAAPGFSITGAEAPLSVRFHCNGGAAGNWSPTVSVRGSSSK